MPKVEQPKFKRGFKSFAEQKSIDLRGELGIKPSYPLPANKLADHLRVLIQYPSDIPGLDSSTLNSLLTTKQSAWSGVTLRVQEKTIVIINSSHSKARQESDIMHELAHIICDHEMGKFAELDNGIFLRDYNESQEKEAEWLGACLQLPRVALHFHYIVYGMSHQEIADKFSASLEMVNFRLRVCSVKR